MNKKLLFLLYTLFFGEKIFKIKLHKWMFLVDLFSKTVDFLYIFGIIIGDDTAFLMLYS